MRLWLYASGTIAALALLAGAYLFGRSDGAALERDKAASIARVVEAERAARENAIDKLAAAAAKQRAARETTIREIHRDYERVVQGDPVVVNVCVPADGVQLLDRAAAAANGADSGGAAARAGEGAAAAPPP